MHKKIMVITKNNRLHLSRNRMS